MRYGFQKRERVGRWFEVAIVGFGLLLIVIDLLFGVNGLLFLGLLVLFVWTFIVGQRNGLLLQEAERKYLKSLRQECEKRVQTSYVVRITMLGSLPIYLAFLFPILLLPYGGMYALAFFIPLFGVSFLRMNNFYQRWKQLEIKPNFYWWMQLGVCFLMIVISFLIFFFGMGGEV